MSDLDGHVSNTLYSMHKARNKRVYQQILGIDECRYRIVLKTPYECILYYSMTAGTTILTIGTSVIVESMSYITCLVINQILTSDPGRILGF